MKNSGFIKRPIVNWFKILFGSILFVPLHLSIAQTNNTHTGSGAGNSGSFNSIFGYQSGDVVTGSYNSFFGEKAGLSNTTGNSNVFIGRWAGKENTTSSYNSYIGFEAGSWATGTYNTFLGANTGRVTVGSYNVFIGYESGEDNSSGTYNTFLGYKSGRKNTSGSYNTFLGNTAGHDNTTGHYNVFVGHRSGIKNVSGDLNVFLGKDAGYNNNGTRNVFVGTSAGYNESGSDKLYIDNSSTSTPLIYGDFSSNRIGINYKNPLYTMHVGGDLGANGDFYGKSVNQDYSSIYKIGGLFLTWDSDSYGTNTQHSIRSTYGNTYGDDITINSFHKLRINLDANNNNTDESFEIGKNTSGTENVLFSILESGAVGIGTGSPAQDFHMVGNRAKFELSNGVVDMVAYGSGSYDYSNASGIYSLNKSALIMSGLTGSGDIKFVTRPTSANYLQRMVIKNDGNVGIATDDPLNKLQVGANPSSWNGNDLVLGNSNGALAIHNANTNTYLYGTQDISLRPGGQLALYTKSDGKVGIGTDDPNYHFHVIGSDRARFQQTNGTIDLVAYGPGSQDYANTAGLFTTGSSTLIMNGLPGSGDIQFVTRPSDYEQQMVIKSDGKVGIGTDNPLNKLQIGANPFSWNGNDLVLGNSNGALAIHNTSTNTYLYGTQDISIRPGTQLALYAKSDGNVGIGTDTPGEKLDVAGNIRASGTISASGYNPSDWNAAFGWGDHASEGYWKEGSNVSVQNITSNAQGTTTMGASSTAGFEFISTLPMFYFNKPLRVDGGLIGSHDEDLQLRTGAVTALTVNKDNQKVTVHGDLGVEGHVTLDTSTIWRNDSEEWILTLAEDGALRKRNVTSIESPWLLEIVGQDTVNIMCDSTLFPSNIVVDVIDLNGNLRIGDEAFIDNDLNPGGLNDDWMKFNNRLEFRSADDDEGIVLFDKDSNTEYLNIHHSGGTTQLHNGNNQYFLQSTGRNVTFGGSVTIPNLAADRLEANDNMVFNFDRLHDAGADHFQIERGGAGGLGLPVPLFRVEDTGNTSVLAGNFTISGGHAFLGASPVEDPSLTQVIVRDPAAGQLKYRNANSFTPWTNNSTYLSYTGKIGINTSSEPATDLEVNGSGKFNSLEVVGQGNASQWNTAYTNRVNPGAGLTWNSTSKDLSVKVGSGISLNASDELELDQSAISITAAQVTGLPWDTSGGSLTYNGPQLGIGDKALDEVLVISNGTIKTVSGSEFTSGGNTPWQVGTGRLDYTGTVDVDGALESTSFNTGAGTFSSVETSTLKISGLISGSTFDRVLMEDGSGNLGYKDLSSFNFSHWDKDASDNLKYEAGTITSTKGIYSEVNSSDLAFVVKSGTTTNFRVDGAGNIRARKLELDLQPSWPDYVFNKDYELRSLEEVETFVKANNHLPDVPSEKEVKENGIDVAEMESVLLRKIEELTLYIIDQNKTIKSQQEELKQQKEDFAARLEALEQKIGQ